MNETAPAKSAQAAHEDTTRIAGRLFWAPAPRRMVLPILAFSLFGAFLLTYPTPIQASIWDLLYRATFVPFAVRNVTVPTRTRAGTEIAVKNDSISSRPSSPSSVRWSRVYRISFRPFTPNAFCIGRFAISTKPMAVDRKIANTRAAVSQSPAVVCTKTARPRSPRIGWITAAGKDRR